VTYRSPSSSPAPRRRPAKSSARTKKAKNRRIEKHLPQWWQRRRQRKRARLARMTRRRRVWRRIGIIGTWFLGFIAAVVAASVVLFYTLSNVPQPQDLVIPQAATITYADGSNLATIGVENRIDVPLSEVPETVRWAFISTEDRNFYSDPGVSIKGTIRAALNDIGGGDTQGGSGITQQYVKNAYLSDSRTLTRKLKELAIAVKLSRDYSKDQILEWYLNTVYFGRQAYGIATAAQTYFHEPVTKLTTAQGAMLAGLLRSPSYYDPANNPTAAKQRWQYVVTGMVTAKHLTQAQADKLTFPTTKPYNSATCVLCATGPSGLIVRQVEQELNSVGISESEINTRGLKIQTTVNRTAEHDAIAAVDTTFANLTPAQRNMKNALVAVNPSSGAILAYYGGTDNKNYAGQPDFNDYAQGYRPPGSSFKPYVLATALSQTQQKKVGSTTTISSLVDGSFSKLIDGTTISNDPSDQSCSSSSVSVTQAMTCSLNTTFDQMALDVGPANVAKVAHSMGVRATTAGGTPTLQNSDGQTNFGIGIGDYPVRPVDQASGFATLADGGAAHDAYLVQKVTDSNGTVLYQHKTDAQAAITPQVANDTTIAMEQVANYSGVPLANGRPSASKTGTEGISPPAGTAANGANTDYGNSDAWMVGFTPQVAAAVWVGSGDSTHKIVDANGNDEYGRDLPAKTWQLFMNTYLAAQPVLPLPTQQQVGVTAPPTSSAPPPSTSSAPQTSASAPTSTPVAPTTVGPTTSSNPPSSPPPSTSSAPPPTTVPPPSTPSTHATAPSPPPSTRATSAPRTTPVTTPPANPPPSSRPPAGVTPSPIAPGG
jgi:membrane peptidoglycan carboxypeptidase